ncbi:transposase [Paenibacillus dendritiformis]|nr:transposase [Paenibacillus dendritiformis]CAH8772927.1 transposase [Paenibacillus dendritiformis]
MVGWATHEAAACKKAKRNWEIRVNMKYLRYKQEARKKLRSEEGYALSVRRMIEPESVFGQMKNKRGFRRFLLRGLSTVSLEVGWLSLAQDLLVDSDEAKRSSTVTNVNPNSTFLNLTVISRVVKNYLWDGPFSFSDTSNIFRCNSVYTGKVRAD